MTTPRIGTCRASRNSRNDEVYEASGDEDRAASEEEVGPELCGGSEAGREPRSLRAERPTGDVEDDADSQHCECTDHPVRGRTPDDVDERQCEDNVHRKPETSDPRTRKATHSAPSPRQRCVLIAVLGHGHKDCASVWVR